MNKIEQSARNPLNLFNRLSGCFLLMIIGVCPAIAGDAYTGKIVIDGKVYDSDNSTVIKGSGVMGRDKRQVGHFQRVKVVGSINVNYRRSQNTHVEITGDKNILPTITTEVTDGELIIDSTKSYQPELPLVVELSSVSLQELALEGSSDVVLKDLNEKAFKLSITGSGSVSAQGKIKQFSADLSGSGDVNAHDLICEQAEVEISGSGSIDITAKNLLKGTISGSGDIKYFGNPKKVEPEITGSGSIEAGS